MLLILDDEPGRATRFRAVARTLGHDAMICFTGAEFRQRIAERPRLISLDHDLRHDDPDDGVLVAKWLVEAAPPTPTIVHSSNGDRARMMLGELELARWPHARVVPFGDDWIEHDWRQTVNALLAAG